ncbi:MAG: DUF3168 domain-containing protein [Erythrobacter sp.]|nr:DUF3168 domain-containing protein [Erythrobacter sp.]
MENLLRAALIDWLRSDPQLASLNAIEEESPLKASVPWLGIAASASADWGTKDRAGREVRVAFELVTRGDDSAADAALARGIEQRIQSLPAAHPEFAVVTSRFIRSRAERRARNLRALLLEYRFRLLANQTE